MTGRAASVRPPDPPRRGVRIAGTGMLLPEDRITNADLEKLMETTDEWILQRTGIRERRRVNPAKGESCWTISAQALRGALADAKMDAADLDLVIVATVSTEQACPSTACRVAGEIGAGAAGAVDMNAACCGFVYATNVAHDLIRAGSYRNIGVVGCDTLSEVMDYSTEGRGTAILFGDAAGAAVLRATDDPSRGIIAQAMHSDGTSWRHLYIPRRARDFPAGAEGKKLGVMYMNGREVFKFAVTKFCDLIAQTLDRAGLTPDDVDHYVCHQSNARILESARERFGLPQEKLYVNIDRVGNTSSGSVPVCLHELRSAGRIREGQLVMLVAFGGGLTWASGLWRM
ncbi:MAG: ketoacyl-ACP synthase III [Phycisphaerales bacterium]|nr:ketoacyl-ACP synthase III [Phycisphaerales bacterium]